MKSTGIIMQNFSIEGIKKQWDYERAWKLSEIGGVPNGRKVTFRFEEGIAKTITCEPGKTETRRLRGLKEINKNPDDWYYEYWAGSPFKNHTDGMGGFDYPSHAFIHKSEGNIITTKCPYGKVGDELWVRESFAKFELWEHNSEKKTMVTTDIGYKYKADNEAGIPFWKSPLFMTRAASRITLQITSIKVERLQDITEEGAMREGLSWKNFAQGDLAPDLHTPSGQYRELWKELHGEASWNKNPWVWVIGFTVKEFK